jgi:aspartate/methionine/tyrosine aminotransferase
MPVAVPELAERAVVINAVSKSYAMTGWRVGWMIAPTDVVAAAINLQSHTTSNVANVSQAAALAAVAGPLDDTARMRDAFDRRRRRMYEMLSDMPGVTCSEPEGAFYAFPSFEGVLGREIGGGRPQNTLELAEIALEAAGVAVVPGEAFGGPGYARLSYALSDDDLVEGLTRLGKLLAG